MKPAWILYMGTFPPRECGIATFTKDLTTAMDKKFAPAIKSKILALNNNGINIYNYSEDVIFEIGDNDVSDYVEVAERINEIEAIKLINIQHEFGIFGGMHNDNLVKFLDAVKKPVVITYHSVIPGPGTKLKNIVHDLSEKSACSIVMTKTGIDILRKDYGVKNKIIMIHHGIPTVPFNSGIKEKTALGFRDKIVLSSFGLISSAKGYEYVIEALPNVIKKFPNIVYLIIGETHPIVRRTKGEQYRNLLEKKVKELGLQKHVKFYNKYITLKEIKQFLQATDVYLSPSLNPEQIVSGTLAYAIGCGKPVISTPFLYAKDLITPKRGLLVKFKDPKSFESAMINLLSNPYLKKKMEKNAYVYTRRMTWPNVALEYINTFNNIIGQFEDFGKILPKIKFTHIRNLTDTFGIFQFSKYTVPDKSSGYTLDDNARALLACAMHYDIYRGPSRLRLIRTYLGFIKYVQQSDGRLYNYVDYSKKINMEKWSRDAHGRALWALGYTMSVKSIPKNVRDEAERIFAAALPAVKHITFPRTLAFTILGLYFYNKEKPSNENIAKIRELADKLVSTYENNFSEKWQWFEERLTYSNSKLPEALFYAHLATNDEKYLKVAKASLDFLISVTFENGMFGPVGNRGWFLKNGQKAYYDQQPIDTASMVQTLIEAYKITKNKDYMKKAVSAFQWFLGKNSLNQVIYDETTGGCHDGIGESSINLNQGAESSIEYLLARLTFKEN